MHEIWVDLEPNGKLHVKIELLWATQDEQNQPNRAFQVSALVGGTAGPSYPINK